MSRFLTALLLSLALAPPASAEVTDAPKAPGASFEALWAAYLRAQRAGDIEGAVRTFQEIRRLRVERNIRSLDVVALALAAEGLDRLGKGEREKAEELFRSAAALDPHLPDAQFGLALTELRKGPLGLLPAARRTVAGVLARFSTIRGKYHLHLLLVPVGMLTLFLTLTVVSAALLFRHGTLLLHDLHESLGVGRSGAVALALFACLLLIPPITFQGWGWLPLWWLALLFVYLSAAEKVVVLSLLAGTLGVGPAVTSLQLATDAGRNPLFWAGAQAVQAGPDLRLIAELEAAVKKYPDDRDLVYLVATLDKKAGRYDEAASLYNEALRTDAADFIAQNNLANLDFARGNFDGALARYKQRAEAGAPPEVAATLSYNQSQAHLQKFEYPAAHEARSQADSLAPGLVADYDRLGRHDKGDYAVADLCLTAEQVRAKFSGLPQGVGRKNVAREPRGPGRGPAWWLPAALNRFAAFAAVFALVVYAVSAWRGRRMFTLRCGKCGTAFCRRCHLGAVVADLCSQCHHLFVVRDGVSGPARNRKLLEVQAEEERRAKRVRMLSLVAPGAGQIYARRTLLGLFLAFFWSLTLVAMVLAGRLLPVTEAPRALARPWGLALAATLLLTVYAAAYRLRADAAGRARRGRPA